MWNVSAINVNSFMFLHGQGFLNNGNGHAIVIKNIYLFPPNPFVLHTHDSVRSVPPWFLLMEPSAPISRAIG